MVDVIIQVLKLRMTMNTVTFIHADTRLMVHRGLLFTRMIHFWLRIVEPSSDEVMLQLFSFSSEP